MNRFNKLFIPLLCLIFISGGCSTSKGIEAGNPDISGKKVHTVSATNDFVIDVEIVDDETANVSKYDIDGNDSELIEQIEVPYFQTGNEISLDAAFKDGTDITLNATFNDDLEELDLVELILNDTMVATEFELLDAQEGCRADPNNDVSKIVAATCSKMLFCFPQLLCEKCRVGVRAEPSLGQEFGLTPGTTLDEAFLQIENGTLTSNETAVQQCLVDIFALGCFPVKNAYDITVPNDYTGLAALYPDGPGTCPEVF